MTYIIAEPCVDVRDRACVDVCPVDCIYELEDTELSEGDEAHKMMLYIHPEECIDCGACEPECPLRLSSLRMKFLTNGMITQDIIMRHLVFHHRKEVILLKDNIQFHSGRFFYLLLIPPSGRTAHFITLW